MPARAVDLTGQTFGRLTVKEKAGTDKSRQALWSCTCACGNEIVTRGRSLRVGDTKSCGCLRKEVHTGNKWSAKHGGKEAARTEYRAWLNLRNDGTYTEEWEDFVQFFCDVGERPSKKHVLKRRDVRKPHSKQNTYWSNTLDERNASEQLQSRDLPEECVFDFRTYLRATAAAG